MAEKLEIEVEVNDNTEATIANLRALKKQLRETAAGSAEFNKVSAQIRDMDDAIKDASKTSDDFAGMLENASGPLGMLGKGIRSAETAFSSFNGALKMSIIGILVAAIGGLVAAFTKSEVAMKKLEPIFIAFEKILGGIFRAFEPVLDAFLELAVEALPYITKGIGMFYSGLFSLFTLIKNVGVSAGKILKGVFTLDFDALKEGATGIKDAFTSVSKTFDDTYKRFEQGTKEQTATEKTNAEERQKILDEQARKRKEAADKAEALRQQNLAKQKEADAVELEAYKASLQEREVLELEALEKLNAQRKILTAAGRTDMSGIEKQYQIELAEIKKKFDEEAAAKQKERDDKAKEALLKKQEEERNILLLRFQTEFEELERRNQLLDNDFENDLSRLAKQKEILAQQEATELQNTELTEFQKTEIYKKYADARRAITEQEVATEQAAIQAKMELNMAYLQAAEGFGNLLGQIAGKNKGLAIAGLVIEQAAGVARIIINTQAAAAKAGYFTPLGIATLATGAISVASAIAATVKGIKQINSVQVPGGGSSGGGASSAPAPSYGGGRQSMDTPQIQGNTTVNPSSQIAQTVAMSQKRPTRAYVVSGDVSSQQALDRRTNTAATFSGN